MDYFISDIHNLDSNIITYEHRPFKDVYEMRKTIIENCNNIIKEHDTLWILGDIGNPEILKELKGNIKIILGNHDNKESILKVRFDIEIYDYPIMVGPLWLSHEPILYMPPEIPYLNIHGHIHSFQYGKGIYWENGRRH